MSLAEDARRQLLESLIASSDTATEQALRLLAEAHDKVTSMGMLKRGWRVGSAYNDSSLGGGGVRELRKKMWLKRGFCTNTKVRI